MIDLLIDILCMFFGGIIGTLIRYGIIEGINNSYHEYFDLATMIANYVGCLFAGILYPFSGLTRWKKHIITTLSVGLCGSLTTFSGYVNHSLNGLKNDHVLSGLGEVLFTFLGCFLFLYLGILLGKLLDKYVIHVEAQVQNIATENSIYEEENNSDIEP